jgi:plasmid maintenance system killer protein
MEVSFGTRKLQKICCSKQESDRRWGQNARKVRQRLAELQAADNLFDMTKLPAARLHELVGKRAGQIAVDVKQPFRLILVPDHDPVPRKEDGGVDLKRVTKILVTEVTDYHGES